MSVRTIEFTYDDTIVKELADELGMVLVDIKQFEREIIISYTENFRYDARAVLEWWKEERQINEQE